MGVWVMASRHMRFLMLGSILSCRMCGYSVTKVWVLAWSKSASTAMGPHTCSHPTLAWPHTCVQIPENEAVIWIDFYCVNQHRPVAAPELCSIADVMKSAGKVRLFAGAGRRRRSPLVALPSWGARNEQPSGRHEQRGQTKVRLVAGAGGRQGVAAISGTAQLRLRG